VVGFIPGEDSEYQEVNPFRHIIEASELIFVAVARHKNATNDIINIFIKWT
jgi:hypothetical protein